MSWRFSAWPRSDSPPSRSSPKTYRHSSSPSLPGSCRWGAWATCMCPEQGGAEGDYWLFNRLADCPEAGSSNPGLGSDVHCSPLVRVDRGSNAIPVHSITAGSANFPDWQIRKAEEILENNIKGPQERQQETGIPCKGSTTKFHYTFRMRIERLKKWQEKCIRRSV